MDNAIKGCFLSIVIIFILAGLLFYVDNNYNSNLLNFAIYGPDTVNYASEKEDSLYNQAYHVALEEYEELQKKKTLVYNRVPKCGSATAIRVLGAAARSNNIKSVTDRDYSHRELSEEEHKNLVMKLVTNITKPWYFNRHIHFLNFTQFGQEMPIYINLVRHPVDRFVSRYYFGGFVPHLTNVTVNECINQKLPRCNDIETQWETLILVPFFCGQDKKCTHPSSYAMQKAKMNTVKFYAFVGILDEFKYFFKLAECFFPKFFTGAYSLFISEKYSRHESKPDSVPNEKLTDINRKIMENILHFDLEFYYFLRQRFYNLLHQMKTQSKCPYIMNEYYT